MAKNNDKRAERMARSNRNVNRAITVLMAGVIAEFYLLMVNNYYVKGGVGQVLTMMTVLQVIDYIGCALFGAGLVVWLMRKKWTRFAPAAPWLLSIGFFFAEGDEYHAPGVCKRLYAYSYALRRRTTSLASALFTLCDVGELSHVRTRIVGRERLVESYVPVHSYCQHGEVYAPRGGYERVVAGAVSIEAAGGLRGDKFTAAALLRRKQPLTQNGCARAAFRHVLAQVLLCEEHLALREIHT